MSTNHKRHGGRKAYTREELIEAVHTFIIEEGRLPTSRDADTGWHGIPTVGAYAREFGSWREAMVACSLPVDPRGGHNKAGKRFNTKGHTRTKIKPTKWD